MMDLPFGDTASRPSKSSFADAADADDLELVQATKAYLACLERGDDPGPMLILAWDRFYRTYEPIVARIARHRCWATGDPDDGVQDVWQTIVTRLAVFQPDSARGSFRTWLLVVARHRLTDRRRGDARKTHPVVWEALPDHLEGTEPDPAKTCEREDERVRAINLLSELQTQVSAISYRVLIFRALEGRAVTEVAQILGLTAAQVRARHHRMLIKLRQLAEPPRTGGSTSTRAKSEKSWEAAQQRRFG